MDGNLLLLIVLNIAFGIVLVYDIMLRIREHNLEKRRKKQRRIKRELKRSGYYAYKQ